jgi:hypothetical protein
MDVEDRQEDSDATQFCFQNLGFFDLGDIHHGSVSGCDDRVRICGRRAIWIAKEENGVANQHEKKQRQPTAHQAACECKKNKDRENPAGFE